MTQSLTEAIERIAVLQDLVKYLIETRDSQAAIIKKQQAMLEMAKRSLKIRADDDVELMFSLQAIEAAEKEPV